MAATRIAAGLLTTALLAAAGLALPGASGILGSGGGAAASSQAPGGEAATTASYPFGWEAALGSVGPFGSGSLVLGGDGPATATFEVPAGTAAIKATAAWSCTPGPCPARLSLLPPGGTSQSVGPAEVSSPPEPAAQSDGDGQASVELASPPAGTWTVSIEPLSPSVNGAGTFQVTVG